MDSSESINCTITSLWNYGDCENYHLAVYNLTGNLVQNYSYYNLTTPMLCQTNWNISMIGSYTGLIENGDTVSVSIEGDKKMISFGVIVFMILFNLGMFLFPMFVPQLSQYKPTDYILKHLIFAGSILFLWLNVTMIRQMGVDAGLGIDNILQGVWWFVTLLVSIIIFSMCYTTLVGYMKMLKDSEMKERNGDY